ncbi:MAG TPA: hypothetical protein VFU02_01440 [Polyangiaceae bacterium]|nr:hypothetical protein [Polyangiaceae bacterium]
MTTHASDIDLHRLADDGGAAVSADVVAHVRECVACAELVRYVRAAYLALRQSMADAAAPEDILQRVIRTVREQGSLPSAAHGLGPEPWDPHDSQ